MHLTRRDLLRKSSAAALATWGVGSAAAVAGVSDVLAPRAARAAVPASWTRALPIPPVITDAEVSLVAEATQQQILDGAPTQMWTLGGSFPGPTIRRPAGERTLVTVTHNLPAAPEFLTVGDDTLSIHHHGAHSASEHDGLPLPEHAINPGESRTYVYDLTEDVDEAGTPLPERAATQWYHDHTHHRTSFNAYMGMAGLFIIDDAFEAALPLPEGEQDVPLFLTERKFTENNQLDVSLYAGAATSNIEVLGGLRLVNGAYRPFMDVEPRRYRFRVMQGAGFSLYNLKLAAIATDDPFEVAAADGVVMQQIATESGMMPARVDRDEILMGPAERVEVVIDFSEFAGQTLTLATVAPRDRRRDIQGTGNANPPAAIQGDEAASDVFMQFRVGATTSSPDTGEIPAELRPVPEWVEELSDQPDRVFVFGTGVDPQGGNRLPHSINGRPFDHERVDATPELGSTESWLLVNGSQKAHYIHLHDVDWYVVSRNGSAPPAHEAALKETFKIDPGEYLLIGTKFTDHVGPYMIHCHMLDHEDSGMMTRWDVVEPGQGQPTTLTEAEQRRTTTMLAAARANPGCPIPGDLIRQLAPTVVLDGDAGSPYTCSI